MHAIRCKLGKLLNKHSWFYSKSKWAGIVEKLGCVDEAADADKFNSIGQKLHYLQV